MSQKAENKAGLQRVKWFQTLVMGSVLSVGAGAVLSRNVGVVMAQEPAATQPAATTQPAARAPSAEGKAQSVSFNELAGFKLKFKYTMSETGEKMLTPGSIDPQIPGHVKELSGKKVLVRGYLLPIEYEAGKSKRFILMRFSPECLFCNMPTVCDWVDASSKDGVAVPRSGQTPVEVTGTLSVGERLEDGLITSVYQMKVDGVEVLKAEQMPPVGVPLGGGPAGGHTAGHGR